MCPNYAGAKVVVAALKFRKKTLNLIIIRCCFPEDGKEIHLLRIMRARDWFRRLPWESYFVGTKVRRHYMNT